ncbi:MAG: phosphoglycolate phosphatase [Burkholderiales bacterium]|nr:phosphoglycolate phosphatase [Burkholderiales bacterium]
MSDAPAPVALRAVLFDLDGTLADTAPDLAHALNEVRRERGLAPLPLAALRPFASAGARGLLAAGFGVGPEDEAFAPLREAFLRFYGARLCAATRLFPGVAELLAAIEARGLAWGIVTNKAAALTHPLLGALGLAERAACVVCGDTTPHVKPHPAPLLHAADALGLSPRECLYAGDDLRDVQAARAAGMPVVAVLWGYGQGMHAWQADAVLAHPADLMSRLGAPM